MFAPSICSIMSHALRCSMCCQSLCLVPCLRDVRQPVHHMHSLPETLKRGKSLAYRQHYDDACWLDLSFTSVLSNIIAVVEPENGARLLHAPLRLLGTGRAKGN